MNYWMLQCNPNHYRWFDYMKQYVNYPDTWGIRLFPNEIESGDTVFIWLSKYKGKETRGIYAMAEVTRRPSEEVEGFPYESQYWIDKEAKEHQRRLIKLELRYSSKSIIDKYIPKDELEEAGLGNLLILRWAQGGIFKLTEQEGEKIKRMVEAR